MAFPPSPQKPSFSGSFCSPKSQSSLHLLLRSVLVLLFLPFLLALRVRLNTRSRVLASAPRGASSHKLDISRIYSCSVLSSYHRLRRQKITSSVASHTVCFFVYFLSSEWYARERERESKREFVLGEIKHLNWGKSTEISPFQSQVNINDIRLTTRSFGNSGRYHRPRVLHITHNAGPVYHQLESDGNGHRSAI